MDEWLSYREAATRTRRSIRSINRWRRGGMPMEWQTRDGQRVRVVRLDILLAWWRDRLASDPAHQYRLRRMQTETTRDTPIAQSLPRSGVIPHSKSEQN